MAILATQMRPGMIIKHNGELHSVFKVEHRTPGNLRAFIQAKLRNLRTGAMYEHRFRSPDSIERVIVDEIDMEFLYADGDEYVFMNTENYEQTTLNSGTLGDAVEYLTANLPIKVSFFDSVAVGIELPGIVELTVVEHPDPLRAYGVCAAVALDDVRGADERRHELVRGMLIDIARRAHLLDPPV